MHVQYFSEALSPFQGEHLRNKQTNKHITLVVMFQLKGTLARSQTAEPESFSAFIGFPELWILIDYIFVLAGGVILLNFMA